MKQIKKDIVKQQGKIPAYVVYAFLWSFFLIIPVITNNYGEEGRLSRIYYDWLRIAPFFIIFLINSFFLLPRLLFRGFTKIYLFTLLLTVLSVSFVYQKAEPELYRNDPELIEQRKLRDPQYGRDEMSPDRSPANLPGSTEIFKSQTGNEGMRSVTASRSAFQFINTFLISLLIAGFNTAIATTNKWIMEEQNRREVEKEHIKTELAFLQNQISPHFFMNTLNNIHALVQSNTELAKDSILKLSALMRYLLYESGRGTTTLRKEAEFLRSYINLMQLRVDKSVSITLDVSPDIADINIPPLLFISFIENAFKHGISYREPSSISFRLLQDKDKIEFISVNTIPVQSASVPSPGNGGIGISNIRKRLDLLYKERYHLEIKRIAKEFRVRLIIPVLTQD